MSFKKKPKQKSSYPGMLSSFEQQRIGGWANDKQKVKPNFNLRQGFVPSARKVPT